MDVCYVYVFILYLCYVYVFILYLCCPVFR
jgi:hypothetical protein